jgi:hypothetical protein
MVASIPERVIQFRVRDRASKAFWWLPSLPNSGCMGERQGRGMNCLVTKKLKAAEANVNPRCKSTEVTAYSSTQHLAPSKEVSDSIPLVTTSSAHSCQLVVLIQTHYSQFVHSQVSRLRADIQKCFDWM